MQQQQVFYWYRGREAVIVIHSLMALCAKPGNSLKTTTLSYLQTTANGGGTSSLEIGAYEHRTAGGMQTLYI